MNSPGITGLIKNSVPSFSFSSLNLLQNPEYKSSLAIKWSGVSVEKLSDRVVQFRLQKAYSDSFFTQVYNGFCI